MPDNDLPSLVRRLHDELASAPSLDDATRSELRNLASDLERLASDLERLAGSPGEESRHTMRGRLHEEVERFEASHPGVAKALANLIDALALYGL